MLTSQQNPSHSSPSFTMPNELPNHDSKAAHTAIKTSHSMENPGSELLLPTVPSNESLLRANMNFANQAGINPIVAQNGPNLLNTAWMEEPPKDWRSSLTQQDRIQVMMRLYLVFY